MHLKRQKTPKNWPVHRKGTAYIVRGRDLTNGIPLLVVLRDVLKLTKDRRETKISLNSGKILLNGKKANDEKTSLNLFDVITVVPSGEHFRVVLDRKGRFFMEKEQEKKAAYKIAKIQNKKMLKGKKIQINLGDGRNFLFDKKCKTNDSVVINLKENKIEKCLELKENANALVIGGKHSGIKGAIAKINEEERSVEIQDSLDKEKRINVLIKQLVIIE